MYKVITPAELEWREGTPYSLQYQDIYFSREDGREESQQVFLHNNKLPERWRDAQTFVIAETGFGSGLNFLLTAALWLQHSEPKQQLHYIAVDKHPLRLADLQKLHACWPELAQVSEELIEHYPSLVPGFHARSLFGGRIRLLLMWGDATEQFSQLHASVDTWYLDGFAPSKNDQMWSSQLFAEIGRLSAEQATATTFTVAGVVKRGLQENGFQIEKVPGFGRKKQNLFATKIHRDKQTKKSEPWFSLQNVSSTSVARVAVIGGGIAGATTAWELAERGIKVHLLEAREQLASAASGNRAGLVLPRFDTTPSAQSEFYLHAFLATLDWLSSQPVAQTYWHQSGVHLQVEQDRARALLSQPLYADLLQIQDGQLVCPSAGWLQPKPFIEGLLRNSTVQLHLQTRVTSLERVGNQWRIFTGDGDTLMEVDAVVLANAHDVNQLGFGDDLHIDSNKGQLVYAQSKQLSEEYPVPQSGDCYVIPMQNGQLVLGASYDAGDKSLEPNAMQRAKIIAAFPGVHDEINWPDAVAFRAVSRDRLPVVGPLTDMQIFRQQFKGLAQGKTARSFENVQYLPDLYVSLAHASRGLTTAYYCARYLADLICGEACSLPADHRALLHPARFIYRDLKKPR